MKILQNKDWILKLEKVKKEVDFMIGRPADELIGDALEIRKISTSYSLISELTRRLAEKTDKDFVLVADLGFFEEFVQIYIRRSEKNNFSTDIFRETALSLGARVGGKEEVAGIIIDRIDFEAYLDKLRKIFSDNDDSTT
ncbi:MAG: hypothetical protein GX817_00670 [Elusimicrobia bacterium]|nr:hypothetical protein [Elusimicrobiota bacterium]